LNVVCLVVPIGTHFDSSVLQLYCIRCTQYDRPSRRQQRFSLAFSEHHSYLIQHFVHYRFHSTDIDSIDSFSYRSCADLNKRTFPKWSGKFFTTVLKVLTVYQGQINYIFLKFSVNCAPKISNLSLLDVFFQAPNSPKPVFGPGPRCGGRGLRRFPRLCNQLQLQ